MFYVYVLKCNDGSFYTGYTNNVEKRLIMHINGKASRYTRNRLPVDLVARWEFKTQSEAMRHEIMFKSLSREAKMERILKGELS